MRDVSVIGTEAMGSAQVEALAASGAVVAAWNRTEEGAKALSGPRRVRIGSEAEALTSSPLTIVAVSDYELARTVVREGGAELGGMMALSLRGGRHVR